ncbi:MAG: cation-translocating P-type ATPase [Bacteroidia bacterium]|nr:cation-translocating P-type ATPase [Bacteroidia bacterium]
MDYEITGLNDVQVAENRLKYGSNCEIKAEKNHFLHVLIDIITEPLFVILVFTALIYFVLGEYKEGAIMLVALLFVSGISLYQENKSDKALKELNKVSNTKAKVIRNGTEVEINSEEIVIDDILIVEQGNLVQADAVILSCYDLTINESILTGESLPSIKTNIKSGGTKEIENINRIFKGTLVYDGNCIAQVTAIGTNTEIGKIGKKLDEAESSKSPLQLQIKSFVKKMVAVGVLAFVMVWGVNFILSKDILSSLLSGLTLAMSILPEEIPVAFSTFMALGAYYLYKKKIIVRSPYTVETLGAATVICIDKTGTITKNEMQLAALYDFVKNTTIDTRNGIFQSSKVLEYAMWSSEINPYDQMEKSIHYAYKNANTTDERKNFKMVHEYPLSGHPPLMTHVYEEINKPDNKIIACKGAIESIFLHSKLSDTDKITIDKHYNSFTSKGYRVLGVAKAVYNGIDLPASQFDYKFDFLGLVAFYDPPKANMKKVISEFYNAGIDVKIITGDNADTTLAIAEQIDFKRGKEILSGNQVMQMSEQDLVTRVKDIEIFARMYPEAKYKVVQALKQIGEVVAMTGDGVNDAPALIAAHIGIAMGERGSEVAKKASSLILMNDDLENMVDAIALGRRIYENLKKAIRYIISIHIPIILVVTLPLLMLWKYKFIFFPIHVIFLELIMGPTCSIIYEREPIEKNSMSKKPRKMTTDYFSWHELGLSIIQGMAITFVCLIAGFYFMQKGYSENYVRTTVFSTLIFSNILLTLTNRSFYFSIFETIKYKNKLIPIIISISLMLLACTLFIPQVKELFKFETITINDLIFCLVASFVGVIWIEVYKFYQRKSNS